jgi:transcription elongation factor GreA
MNKRMPILLTEAGRTELLTQLTDLEFERNVEMPMRRKQVMAFGSGSENDEYLQLLEEEAVLSARIEDLHEILSQATVLEANAIVADRVSIGSAVALKIEGKRVERRLTGAYEPDQPGHIKGVSVISPIGRAISGQRVGAVVTAELSDGRRRSIEILSVNQSTIGRRDVRAA